MKKGLLLLITFVLSLFPSSLWAQEDPSQQRLVVWLKSGEKVTYQLDKMPRPTFVGTQLTIATNSGASVSYPLSAVLRYTYEGTITAIESLSANPNELRFSQNNEAMKFEGLPEGTRLEIYAMDGKLLTTQSVEKGKPSIVSLKGQPTGTYIVKAGNTTFKFLKR